MYLKSHGLNGSPTKIRTGGVSRTLIVDKGFFGPYNPVRFIGLQLLAEGLLTRKNDRKDEKP